MYFPFFKKSFRNLLSDLGEHPILVLSHVRSDGDSIGSQVALIYLLRALGKEALGVYPDGFAGYLEPFIEGVPFLSQEALGDRKYTVITVDCASYERVGMDLSSARSEVFANFDHHISNTGYGEYNFVGGELSSTAELIAGLALDADLPITPQTAQALYLGIASDTGQFRYNTTSRRVFELASKLLEYGASVSKHADCLYNHLPFERLALLGQFLTTLKLELEGKVCIGYLKQSFYETSHASLEASEGFVDYVRDIKGVKVGVLLEERLDGQLKGSLRANSDHFRMNELAQKWSGGGHGAAAGFNLETTIEAFYPKLLEGLRTHLEQVKG